MERCWGCHHITEDAFGPPLKWVAKNREPIIRNSMPRMKLT
ncbi:hypothetical protein [Thermocrinis minervae]|nr:hypothetical protein [Thermocrinis minervae]